MASDYKYQNQILAPLNGRQCLSALSSGQVITAKTGTIGANNWTDTTATITVTDVGVWGNQLNGFVFADAVVTASGEPSQTSSNSVASTPAMTGTPSQITANSARHSTSSSASSSASASSSILSTTGGKIGIYLGVPLGAVILCCFIGIILLYRRRASRLDKQFAELEGRDISAPIILQGPPPPRPPPPTELWSAHEKETGRSRHEMETWERPVEMWAGGIKN